MGFIEVIVAVVKAYMDREKERENEQRTQEIIKQITGVVESNRQVILDALWEATINELNGLYFGANLAFKEYKGGADEKEELKMITHDTNVLILGRLQVLYDTNNELVRVRKIVGLMTLVVFLRATVLTELKYKHGEDNDTQINEQLTYLKNCWDWDL